MMTPLTEYIDRLILDTKEHMETKPHAYDAGYLLALIDIQKFIEEDLG